MNNFIRNFVKITVLIICIPVTAKEIRVDVAGFETMPNQSVPISIDWDESWFGKDSAKIYNHDIARIACLFSEISYVDVEKRFPNDELTRAYESLGIKAEKIDYHYAINYNDPILGNDQVAFSIASKEILSSQGKKKLVFVVIRGTPTNANEWISNANVNDDGEKISRYHEGFTRAMTIVRTALLHYLETNNINPQSAFYLITGHSRGGAVANLLAASFSDDKLFDTNFIYAYTFASPNVTTVINSEDSKKFGNIWNIVNAEDIVPTVPLAPDGWNYHKFGTTLTLINSWNCDPEQYENDYLPRMNNYFEKFLSRNYCPFQTGPFVPVQFTRILKMLNKDVQTYYTGPFGLHKTITSLLENIFTKNTSTSEIRQAAPNKLMNYIKTIINQNYDNIIDYSLKSFTDMHACETYLSWLLSMNKDELYSKMYSTQLILKGNYNCAVLNKNNDIVLLITDGHIEYATLKRPIAALQISPSTAIIGFPSNATFSVLISKQSLLVTPVTLTLEHYDSQGILTGITDKKTIFPFFCLDYKITDAITTEKTKIDTTHIWGKDAVIQSHENKIIPGMTFRLQPEVTITTESDFGLGITTGIQYFYGGILAEYNVNNLGNYISIAPGVGTQLCLTGPLMMDTEFYWKFFKSYNGSGTGTQNNLDTVPSFRLLFSIKPRHRFQFFVAGTFDLHIKNMNDNVFDSQLQPENGIKWSINDSVDLSPGLLFGFRF